MNRLIIVPEKKRGPRSYFADVYVELLSSAKLELLLGAKLISDFGGLALSILYRFISSASLEDVVMYSALWLFPSGGDPNLPTQPPTHRL